MRLGLGKNLRHCTLAAFEEIQPHPLVRHPTDFQNFAVRSGQDFVFQSFAHVADSGTVPPAVKFPAETPNVSTGVLIVSL